MKLIFLKNTYFTYSLWLVVMLIHTEIYYLERTTDFCVENILFKYIFQIFWVNIQKMAFAYACNVSSAVARFPR